MAKSKLKIKIKEDKYYLLFDEGNILRQIKKIALAIKNDYQNNKTPPILIAVLTGGMYFAIDLSKELGKIGLDHHLDTIGLKRYAADEKGGAVEILSKPHADLAGRDLIIVEDVIDNGATMNFLDDYLNNSSHKPTSVRYASLLVKKNHGLIKFKISYQGFEIGPEWIVGYGMDSSQSYRYLTNIYVKLT